MPSQGGHFVDRDGQIIRRHLGFSYSEEFEENLKPPPEIQDEQAKKDRVVMAVQRLADTLQKDNREAFNKQMGENVTLSPDELWKGCKRLLDKFGKIRRIEFSEFDADGAFIKVEFERATREIFVRLKQQMRHCPFLYDDAADNAIDRPQSLDLLHASAHS